MAPEDFGLGWRALTDLKQDFTGLSPPIIKCPPVTTKLLVDPSINRVQVPKQQEVGVLSNEITIVHDIRSKPWPDETIHAAFHACKTQPALCESEVSQIHQLGPNGRRSVMA